MPMQYKTVNLEKLPSPRIILLSSTPTTHQLFPPVVHKPLFSSFLFILHSKLLNPFGISFVTANPISFNNIFFSCLSKPLPLLVSLVYLSENYIMCGGAIIEGFIPRQRGRRITASDLWPDSPFATKSNNNNFESFLNSFTLGDCPLTNLKRPQPSSSGIYQL